MPRPIDYDARNKLVRAVQAELAVPGHVGQQQIAAKLHTSPNFVNQVARGLLTIIEPGVQVSTKQDEDKLYKDDLANPVLTVVGTSMAGKPIVEHVPDPPAAGMVTTSSEFKTVQSVTVGALTRAEVIEALANMARNARLDSKARRAARQAMASLI